MKLMILLNLLYEYLYGRHRIEFTALHFPPFLLYIKLSFNPFSQPFPHPFSQPLSTPFFYRLITLNRSYSYIEIQLFRRITLIIPFAIPNNYVGLYSLFRLSNSALKLITS